MLSLLDPTGHLSNRLLNVIDSVELVLRQDPDTPSNVALALKTGTSNHEGNEVGAIGINLLEGTRVRRGSATKQVKGRGMKENAERLEIVRDVATSLLLQHGALHECPHHVDVLLNTDNPDFLKSAKREGRQMAFDKRLKATKEEISIAIDDIYSECQHDCAQCEEDEIDM